MEGSSINEMLNDAFRDTVAGWKKEGLSDAEIIAKIEKINFNDVMMSITDTISTDFADFFQKENV